MSYESLHHYLKLTHAHRCHRLLTTILIPILRIMDNSFNRFPERMPCYMSLAKSPSSTQTGSKHVHLLHAAQPGLRLSSSYRPPRETIRLLVIWLLGVLIREMNEKVRYPPIIIDSLQLTLELMVCSKRSSISIMPKIRLYGSPITLHRMR